MLILLVTTLFGFDWEVRGDRKVAFVFFESSILKSTTATPLNTIVYIDGFNLYHSLRDTSYKWLNIEVLMNSILVSSWHNIIKIKYFTANTPFSKSAQRQDVYLRVIDNLEKVEIVRGKFKKRYIKLTQSG